MKVEGDLLAGSNLRRAVSDGTTRVALVVLSEAKDLNEIIVLQFPVD